MRDPHTTVLIVGAGLAGLTAATLLGWHGVPCLLVDRRSAPSRHPRARGVNLRSMELLRGIPGLEDQLHNAGRAGSSDFTIVIAESVTGREIRTLLAPGTMDTTLLSPAAFCSAGQDRVELILLRQARALGADIRLGTELVTFTHSETGIHATLRDVTTREQTQVEADHLIGADGHRSAVRRALGIGMRGRGTLSHNMSILFRADLGVPLRDRGFVLYYLQNPGFTGVFVSTDDPNIGQVSVEYDPSRESPTDYDPVRCVRMVRAALGMPELTVTILDVMPWEMSSLLAERMALGRVFLAGDAAHTMPPTGGLGGQTAMQDAADLAWKLALVLKGKAGAGLLDTYDAERRPVAALTVARQTENYVERLRPDRTELSDPGVESDYLTVAMGYRYRSDAILADIPDDDARGEDPLHPTGRPGTRLAHVPLLRDGGAFSTLDLIGRDFTLLIASDGSGWLQPARAAAERFDIPLTTCQIGTDALDRDGVFLSRTGLSPSGALLVRPDGFIAWRSGDAASDPRSVIEHVLARVLCWTERAA